MTTTTSSQSLEPVAEAYGDQGSLRTDSGQDPTKLGLPSLLEFLDEPNPASDDGSKMEGKTTVTPRSKESKGTASSEPEGRKNEGFEERERWNGIVLKCDAYAVTVRLMDPYGVKPDEEAEFLKTEVPSRDRDLVREGAQFYWTVGTRTTLAGGDQLISDIRFQRLPKLSETDVEHAQITALKLAQLFE